MALHPHMIQPAIRQVPESGDVRVRRLCWLAIAAAVLLGAYAGTLSWLTQRVEAGVQHSIQPLPALMLDRPGG